MINLPPQLTPSELLCYEELLPFVDELLQGSRSLRRKGNLPQAERCALDAVEACQEAGEHANRGVALIHLADVHQETGRLGPALANCQQAHRIFQRQASHYQRHNEAIAAYALGLVHQSFGSEMNALKWYQKSDELLERVKDDWAAVNAKAWVETCIHVRRWVETLSEYLTAARTQPDTNLTTRIWVPVVPSALGGGGFAIAELEVDRYRVERELTINGESFRVQPLKGNQRISLEPGIEYYAMEIPSAAHASLGTDAGDYALVVCERDDNKEGPGVLETLSGPEFGRFERDTGGNVNFVRTDTTVIGAKDIGRDQIRYIAALLKPA